jgi:hypothetical protein
MTRSARRLTLDSDSRTAVMTRPSTGLRLSILVLLAAPLVALAQDPCASFAWNVSPERALFAGSAQALVMGHDAASAPALKSGQLYELALTPQSGVQFAAAPGKKALADGAFAGIAQVHIAAAGLYRVSLSEAFWVDVIHEHQVVDSKDFTGNHSCHAPRKIVLYQLPAGDVLLQLSGATDAHVRVTVTRAPAS